MSDWKYGSNPDNYDYIGDRNVTDGARCRNCGRHDMNLMDCGDRWVNHCPHCGYTEER